MNECNKQNPRKECRHAETENGGRGHASPLAGFIPEGKRIIPNGLKIPKKLKIR